jgi:hypothetical protein
MPDLEALISIFPYEVCKESDRLLGRVRTMEKMKRG